MREGGIGRKRIYIKEKVKEGREEYNNCFGIHCSLRLFE